MEPWENNNGNLVQGLYQEEILPLYISLGYPNRKVHTFRCVRNVPLFLHN